MQGKSVQGLHDLIEIKVRQVRLSVPKMTLFVTCCPFSFLEGDEDEDTCRISQEDIADAVDITAGAKVRHEYT